MRWLLEGSRYHHGIMASSWHHPGIGIPPFGTQGIQGAAFQSTQNLTRVDLGPPASTHAVPLGAPFGTAAAAAAVGALDGDRVLGAAAPHGLHTRPEGGVLGLQDFSLGRDDDFKGSSVYRVYGIIELEKNCKNMGWNSVEI